MKGTILLNYSENTGRVEQEEKARFLHDLLQQIGVPVQEIWNIDDELSVEQKGNLRVLLAKFNVQVIDDSDGGLQVYVDNDKVAEWYKPTYKLKRDFSQRERKKQIYLEMSIEYWSLFEESEGPDPKE